MSQTRAYLCGVSAENCIGTDAMVGGNEFIKVHSTRDEAFRCMQRHLVTQGYTQIGPREFAPPDDGPVLLLNKRSKFGGVLRRGKEDRLMRDNKLGHVY